MPDCDYFATLEDHATLLNWVFAEGACRVYELASDYGQSLKEFCTSREVLSQFERSYETGEKWLNIHLQLHVLGSGLPFVPRPVALDPKTCNGATFRYAADGVGLVQLYLAVPTLHGLPNSHTNYLSQKRVEGWSGVEPNMPNTDALDPLKISKFSARLHRRIKALIA